MATKRREKVDNKPVALPVGYKPPTEADRLKGLMSRLIGEMHGRSDVESFEDSLDFDTGDDDDDPFPSVSHSELRYMKEETMLTDAREADRVVRHRRDDANYKERYYGKGNSGERREGSRSDGSEAARGERGKAGEQSAEQRSDARAPEKSGDGHS